MLAVPDQAVAKIITVAAERTGAARVSSGGTAAASLWAKSFDGFEVPVEAMVPT